MMRRSTIYSFFVVLIALTWFPFVSSQVTIRVSSTVPATSDISFSEVLGKDPFSGFFVADGDSATFNNVPEDSYTIGALSFDAFIATDITCTTTGTTVISNVSAAEITFFYITGSMIDCTFIFGIAPPTTSPPMTTPPTTSPPTTSPPVTTPPTTSPPTTSPPVTTPPTTSPPTTSAPTTSPPTTSPPVTTPPTTSSPTTSPPVTTPPTTSSPTTEPPTTLSPTPEALPQIGGSVWVDTNSNGIQDAGEPGIQDIVVELVEPGTGVVVESAITDADGFYSFELAFSFLLVRLRIDMRQTGIQGGLASPTGASSADLDSDGVQVGNFSVINTVSGPDYGEVDFTFDFGFILPTAVRGKLFFDLDEDGLQDASFSDPGIVGVTVRLVNAQNIQVGETITDSNGLYRFAGLQPMTNYVVKVALNQSALSGSPLTLSNVGAIENRDSDAVLSAGFGEASFTTLGFGSSTMDFGFKPRASISGRLWRDRNTNGARDASETAISDIFILLLSSSFHKIGDTTTDSDGKYYFSGLQGGTTVYAVISTEFPPLDSTLGVTFKDRVPDNLDSDAMYDGKNAWVETTLPPFGASTNRDFGFLFPSGNLRISLLVLPPTSTRNLAFSFTGPQSLTPVFLDGNPTDGDSIGTSRLYSFINLGTYKIRIAIPLSGYFIDSISCNSNLDGNDFMQTSTHSVEVYVDRNEELMDCVFTVSCTQCS